MQRGNQSLVIEYVLMAFATIQELHILMFVIFFLIFFLIVLENLALLIIIIADSRLHVPMYFFLWNFTFLELGHAFAVMPRLTISFLTGNNRISFNGCAVQMFFTIFLGTGSFFVVVVMAYDRYVAVSNPLRYKLIITGTICWKSLMIVLIITVMSAVGQTVLVFSLPYCESNVINHFYCDVAQVVILASNCTSIFFIYESVFQVIGSLTFNVPALLTLVSYVYIVSAILKIRTTEGRLKAFYSCASHLSMVILSYTCLLFIYLRPKSSYLWDENRLFNLIFMNFTAFANPLLYSLRNKVVQSAFRKTFSGNNRACTE